MRGPKCPDCHEEVQEDECEAAVSEAGSQWDPVFLGSVFRSEFVQPQLNVFATPSVFCNMTDFFHIHLWVFSANAPCGCYIALHDSGTVRSHYNTNEIDCVTHPRVMAMVCKTPNSTVSTSAQQCSLLC